MEERDNTIAEVRFSSRKSSLSSQNFGGTKLQKFFFLDFWNPLPTIFGEDTVEIPRIGWLNMDAPVLCFWELVKNSTVTLSHPVLLIYYPLFIDQGK